jgi:hypothetical protein
MSKTLLVLFLSVLICSSSYTTSAQQRSQPAREVEGAKVRCKPNPDPHYVRSRVLGELANVLNESIPEYSKGFPKGFYSDSENAVGFFVFDLTNPTNKQLTFQDCVDFINGHVYHVAPEDSYYSLSQIVILEEGKLKVFRSVNCPPRGDRLEDAISYVSAKLAHDKQRDEVINRVRNYKKYGSYGSLHHAASVCEHRK